MKKISLLTGMLLMVLHFNGYSQEKYGGTLNLGLGVAGHSGYYKYAGRSIPVFNINYEFDVAKNFTLAPFASIYTFRDEYYWGNNNNPGKYYNYREVVIPVGVKGFYYFDDLINLTSDWDFYAGASLGFAIVNSSWESGYLGDKNYYHRNNNVFLDIHVGASYHFNEKIGAYIDLSSGISTIGIQIQ
ncbi:hypothetical protein [Fulvivirga lutea]|uniref:Outer membrane protein beta-barrel domain-containing protein n=1 Tax=Fulvivirga lutea TaxID=2810512 RepID=A0A974WEA5_9BACT|nr:hypothetical protein [Fulvivirga lutea]QSE96451.1 hypothetical protein JR347_12675 [Fulvivirga lutea]